LARKSGASAKFCGSGGAIIGMYADDNMLNRLRSDFEKQNVNILLPNIVYEE
jgi:glucuronokinase